MTALARRLRRTQLAADLTDFAWVMVSVLATVTLFCGGIEVGMWLDGVAAGIEARR